MRLIALISSFVVCGLAPLNGSEGSLSGFSDKLTKAQSLTLSETVQTVNGAAENITATFAKPNKARIDFGTQLVVADGTTVITYDKTRKVYKKEAQNATAISGLLAGQDLAIWSTFYGNKSFDAASGKDAGQQTVNGQTLNKVTFALGTTTVTGFFGTDGLLVKALLTPASASSQGNTILNVSDLGLDGAVTDSTFQFKAPADAQEVSADEFNGMTWYTDLGQAEDAAAKQGKHIFVDFMASWCGPCKMLDREVFTTDKFKQTNSSFVFVRIDVDQQPTVSQRYGIEAMPTQMVLDEKGNILGKTVGYGGPDAFFSFLNPYLLK